MPVEFLNHKGLFLLMRIKMNENSVNWHSWQWQVSNSIFSTRQLKMLLGDSPWAELPQKVEKIYPVKITPYYLSLVDPDDPNDPIARQSFPDIEEIETEVVQDSSEDPLNEHEHMVLPGLIHRYPDRVLLLAAHECAVRCRHCNRKRTWRRPEAIRNMEQIDEVCRYLREHPDIREVILSGGDPLMLPLEFLEQMLRKIKEVSRVEVIRIGTRVPVTLPMKITEGLVDLLKRYRPLWVNTHFNHPLEITKWSRRACEMLLCAGIPVSNQTVLLKGVNDRTAVLKELFTTLQAMMVRPYYLFQCDKVMGTDHFRVPLSIGIEIMEDLWCKIGGLCMPKFVVDLPEGGGKALTMPCHLLAIHEGEAIFRTLEGRKVRYLEPAGSD